jgi:hypothetical protein
LMERSAAGAARAQRRKEDEEGGQGRKEEWMRGRGLSRMAGTESDVPWLTH